jgi:glycoprotein-N-acetylgalactosamine 3-beta-galactosyltransferase
MENLRQFLYQYHAQTSLFIGFRMAPRPNVRNGALDGFMHGAGHIFSRKALKKFNEIAMKNQTMCPQNDTDLDDVLLGKCMQKISIFVDDVDDHDQKRFLTENPEVHFQKQLPDYWYTNYLWANVTNGLKCCSDQFVLRHWVKPQEFRLLDYLIYKVHPYGLQKHLDEQLPRKYSLNEVIAASDRKSFAVHYVEHEHIHYIDDDERY